jgi:hypothetical protein
MIVGDEWIAREESEMDVGDGLGIWDGLFLSLTLINKWEKWNGNGKVKLTVLDKTNYNYILYV